ncbi:Outer membrane usher protein fimD precursor [Shimwellia blattae]|nr:Outer membrane usher protein fimD precursor [Shimwellia blattae]
MQQGYGNRGDGANGSVSLSYQGGYANSNMGYNYSRGARQLNYGLSGGIVIHEEGLTLSQPLSDTNVLIAAPAPATPG